MKAVTTSKWIHLFLGFLAVVAALAALAAVTALTTSRTVFLMFLFLIPTGVLFLLLGLLIYKAWQAFCWVIRQIATRASVPVEPKTLSSPIAFRSSGPKK